MLYLIIILVVIPYIIAVYLPRKEAEKKETQVKPSTLDGQQLECLKAIEVPVEEENGTITIIRAVVGEIYTVVGMTSVGDVVIRVADGDIYAPLEELPDYFRKLGEEEN